MMNQNYIFFLLSVRLLSAVLFVFFFCYQIGKLELSIHTIDWDVEYPKLSNQLERNGILCSIKLTKYLQSFLQ